MAQKRSRAAFEAGLQAQQSPYVFYGTPLPPLDPDIRDDGSYVPVWKQEVRDDQGRKRLHGAFTGGFSAGYFNTVGSKEGWTPSTFVSSRSSRKNQSAESTQQRPEDFMDEEDLAEAEEAKTLRTTDAFAGIGPAEGRASGSGSFMDIFRAAGETMGTKLLKKMGWREGQGIGPKIRREAHLNDQAEGDEEMKHLFAPENSPLISFTLKNDRKGLGFSVQMESLRINDGGGDDADDRMNGHSSAKDLLPPNEPISKKTAPSKGGIGVGILNDDGSDNEDPYAIGPSLSYNRFIGGDKKKKKKKAAGGKSSSANPTLGNKPIFISKKAAMAKGDLRFRKCHDGRLPIDGFILSNDDDESINSAIADMERHKPPTIPEGWKSAREPAMPDRPESTEYKSPAEVAAASKLSPRTRAALLGEAQLPGKSVFDFLSPAARSQIANATGNEKLPPARGEAAASVTPTKQTLHTHIPQLSKDTALNALGRGTSGWMPYTEDLAKRARYQSFLQLRAGLTPPDSLPGRAPGANNADWVQEMQEFARAAEMFKPMTGTIANRFVSSSSAPSLASDNPKGEESQDGQLVHRPDTKPRSAAEQAAALGMYGPLTRTVGRWYPSRLLCKRVNVPPPDHAELESGGGGQGSHGDSTKRGTASHSSALPSKKLELIGKDVMADFRIGGHVTTQQEPPDPAAASEALGDQPLPAIQPIATVDTGHNDAVETQRPDDAVFKSIYGDTDEEQ